ncbi:MAG: hypothetical protein QG623_491 [Patescibacteria group bacterium]|nr:hypothetical protein [Patescibacteria group bacterium]
MLFIAALPVERVNGIMLGMSKFKFMFGGARSVVPLGLNSLYL